MKARIKGIGEIELPKPTGSVEKKWFLDWVLKTPSALGKHFRAGQLAFEAVAPYTRGETAVELFGGIGAQTLMIQKLFAPLAHKVLEVSEDAVQHLERITPDDVMVVLADAYTHPLGSFDLVAADFGDLTVRWTLEGDRRRKLLDTIFASSPEAVVLTDIAGPYLHLQRTRYEEILGKGTCGSYESYLEAFGGRLQELYGYTVAGGGYHRSTAVLGLVPERKLPEPKPLERVVSHGLEIVR